MINEGSKNIFIHHKTTKCLPLVSLDRHPVVSHCRPKNDVSYVTISRTGENSNNNEWDTISENMNNTILTLLILSLILSSHQSSQSMDK